MNCYQHSERPAETVCTLCEKPVCQECLVCLGDQAYCRQCIKDSLSEPNKGQDIQQEEFKLKERGMAETSPKRHIEKRSRFLTFILSLIPGVGYLYLGLMKRGLQTLVTFFGTIFVGKLIGLDSIVALVVPVLMFYTIFDSQQLVRQINDGEKVEDNELFSMEWFKPEHKWIGYGLIILGVLALLNNMVPMLIPRQYLRSVIGPLVIIGVGVYILYKNTKPSSGGRE